MSETMLRAPDAPADRAALRVAWYSVAVLLLFYTFSTIDRAIIAMMVQPLERDLHVTDFQISLLQGPAFGLFYVICGLPMGWLLDRFSRRWIGAVGVTVWGLATCYCGMASGVAQLFFGRMGVGVGESVLTPAAHSIIAEQFPPKRLSAAISVFTLGSVIGLGIALALGGTVVHIVTHMPPVRLPVFGVVRAWQLAFLIVGVPTLVIMPLMFTIRERRARRSAATVIAEDDGLFAPEAASFFRSHWKLVLLLPAAFGLINVIGQAYSAWIPTFMIRTFGWNTAQIGVAFGLILVFGGGAGQMLGGYAVDWLYGRGVKDAHVLYPMAAVLISVPCTITAFLCHNPYLFLALIAVFFTLTYPFVGYSAAALQLFAPSKARGQVSALFLATVTILGTSFGPTAPAWLTEKVFHDQTKMGLSLVIVSIVVTPLVILTLWQVSRVMKALQPNLVAAT
jgi:MFS family permease